MQWYITLEDADVSATTLCSATPPEEAAAVGMGPVLYFFNQLLRLFAKRLVALEVSGFVGPLLGVHPSQQC